MNYCEDDKEKRAWIMICQVVISPDHCDQEDIKYSEAEISWGDKILTKGLGYAISKDTSSASTLPRQKRLKRRQGCGSVAFLCGSGSYL